MDATDFKSIVIISISPASLEMLCGNPAKLSQQSCDITAEKGSIFRTYILI